MLKGVGKDLLLKIYVLIQSHNAHTKPDKVVRFQLKDGGEGAYVAGNFVREKLVRLSFANVTTSMLFGIVSSH